MEIYIGILIGICGGLYIGYMSNAADVEYYRTLVYAYEQKQTREVFHKYQY